MPDALAKDPVPSSAYRDDKNFFGISTLQGLIFAGIAVGFVSLSIFFGLINSGKFLDPFTSLTISEFIDNTIFSISENGLVAKLGSAIQWFIVGSVLYLLVWIMIVFLVDGYNNVLISNSFSHPKSFHLSNFWGAIVARFITRALAALLLLLMSVSLFYVVPYWLQASVDGALTEGFMFGLMVVALSIFFYLYIYTLLLRFLLLRKRVF